MDPTPPSRTLEWSFDDWGRLAATSDPAASYVFQYDNLDRMTHETQTINGLAPQVKTSASFNRVGNRTWFAADLITGSDYAFDFLNTYLYDGLNRITYMAQNLRGSGSQFHAVQPKSATIAYNALGQTTFLSRYQNVTLSGDNLRTVSVYDDTHRLTTLSHRNIGSYNVLSNYAFQYDDMNRITQINHTAAVSAHADGISDFTYDSCLRTRTFTKLANPNLYELGFISYFNIVP